MVLSERMDHVVRQATPWASDPVVVRLRLDIETLESQLAAQREIVKVDGALIAIWDRLPPVGDSDTPMEDAVTAAAAFAKQIVVCPQARMAAEQIDKENKVDP